MPSTMKNYILGIERIFASRGDKVNFLNGDIFTEDEQTLMAVIENKFAEQQRRGVLTGSHISLDGDDRKTLFPSSSCSPGRPPGYLNRLFLVLGDSRRLRTTSVRSLTAETFKEIHVDFDQVLTFSERIHSSDGSRKRKRDI